MSNGSPAQQRLDLVGNAQSRPGGLNDDVDDAEHGDAALASHAVPAPLVDDEAQRAFDGEHDGFRFPGAQSLDVAKLIDHGRVARGLNGEPAGSVEVFGAHAATDRLFPNGRRDQEPAVERREQLEVTDAREGDERAGVRGVSDLIRAETTFDRSRSV